MEDCLLKASNLLNLQLLTLRQGQVNAIKNVVENQKSPEVLKSRTSNRVSPDPLVLVLRPLGDSGDENGSTVDVYEGREGNTYYPDIM